MLPTKIAQTVIHCVMGRPYVARREVFGWNLSRQTGCLY